MVQDSSFSRDYSIRYASANDACTIRFFCFDTTNAITLFGMKNAEELLLSVRDTCLRLHGLWSPFGTGDIARINAAGKDERVPVASETAALLGAMCLFAKEEPCFNPAIGCVSELFKGSSEAPSEDRIAEMLGHTDIAKLHVEGKTVVKDDALLHVDAGAAAKGYAADMIAAGLAQRGVTCADIDLSGNLYMLGKHPKGRPWRIEVALPDNLDALLRFEVSDKSVVTSSVFERGNHIVDPLTGHLSQGDIVSATVVHASSLVADMLSTAVLAGGMRELHGFAARHSDAEIAVVCANGEVVFGADA